MTLWTGAAMLRSFFADPKVFNYIIMVLYAMNACRWGFQRSWADVAYWTGALWITASVTFGYSH